MNNRPKRSVWPLHCPKQTVATLITRTAAAVTVLVPIVVPGCCIVARAAA